MPNPESVRVICRFRPPRSQLIKGGGAHDSTRPATAGSSGSSSKRISLGSPPSAASHASKELQRTESGGAHNPNTGYKLEYGQDQKNITLQMPAQSGTPRSKPHQFTFDRVLGPSCTQAEVFEAVAKDTVADVLKGYHGTVFAYGQTGSGKSHSMFGVQGQPSLRGVIPRAVDALFAGISASEELEEVTIKCSFLEVYLESIRDLLRPKNSNLKIREMKSGEVYVQGLSDEYVSSREDIMALLALGERNRTVAATDMNEVSSRSHSVLILVTTQKLKDGSVRVGKLNLADLAGSERVDRTNATGQTLEQAKKINQSLSALGNCINALTDVKRSHIPYRDSTLTFLLSDALGGNSKTTLLVCASMEENDVPETLSTLQFAKRAKKIKNPVSVNVQLSVAELTNQVALLQKELALAHKTIVALQSALRTMHAGGSIPEEMIEKMLKPMEGATPATLEQLEDGLPAGLLSKALSSTETVDATPSSPTPPEYPDTIEGGSVALLSSSAPTATRLEIDALLTPEPQEGILEESTPLQEQEEKSDATTSSSSASAASTAANSPLPPPVEPAPSIPPEFEEKLSHAHTEIDTLKTRLETVQKEAQDKEAEWAAERERLLAEVQAAQAKAAAPPPPQPEPEPEPEPAPEPAPAPTAAPPSPSAAPTAAPSSSDTSSSDSQSQLISKLQYKNEQLVHQMEEMKATWAAYLDLLLEEQKRQEEERKEERMRMEAEAVASVSQHQGPKIVKPVRKSGGFFSTLFRTNSSNGTKSQTSSPALGPTPSPLSTSPVSMGSSSPLKSTRKSLPPKAKTMRPGGRYHTMSPATFAAAQKEFQQEQAALNAGSPASAASAASPTQGHQRTHSHTLSSPLPSAPSSVGFEQAIRLGYLWKKPIGFSLSSQWRKRLFILRPHSLDYYDIAIDGLEPEQSSSGSAPTSAPPTPAFSPALSSTAPGSSLLSSPHLTASSPTASPAVSPTSLPPLLIAPPDLLDHLRGTLALDAHSIVLAVSYPDAPYGIEFTSKGVSSKLHAATEEERSEWMRDIQSVVNCLQRGIDPAVLLEGFVGEESPSPSPPPAGQDLALDSNEVQNANFLLKSAIARLPSPSEVAKSPPPELLNGQAANTNSSSSTAATHAK